MFWPAHTLYLSWSQFFLKAATDVLKNSIWFPVKKYLLRLHASIQNGALPYEQITGKYIQEQPIDSTVARAIR